MAPKFALPLACASLFAWGVLAVARGRFWRADVDEHRSATSLEHPSARVEAVVPARNEAETIGPAIASLVAQRYGALGITLVDDASTDDTARIAVDAVRAQPERERLRVISGRPLVAPWMGKLNALDTGIASVSERGELPDFWLFTDADIVHDPQNVEELVRKAESDGLDLVSLMVQLRCESGWERLLVPAFIFFFAKLYPFSWSNTPGRATAAAAGGCMLVRARALERIGGFASIASSLIDDCALAAAIKATGGTTWIGLTAQAESIRAYGTLEPFWSMVKRSAFTQLNRSYALTLGATLVMALLYLAPPTLAVSGLLRLRPRVALVATAAWLLMSALYVPTLRAYGRPKREALGLPLAASLYMAMTLDSAVAHARGRGGAWKGRVQRGVE